MWAATTPLSRISRTLVPSQTCWVAQIHFSIIFQYPVLSLPIRSMGPSSFLGFMEHDFLQEASLKGIEGDFFLFCEHQWTDFRSWPAKVNCRNYMTEFQGIPIFVPIFGTPFFNLNYWYSMQLYNTLSAKEREQLIEEAGKDQLTISFYQYAHIGNTRILRNHLFLAWNGLDVLGRIYVAHEGINAQLSVPAENFEAFKAHLDSISFLENVRLNIAI